MKLALSAMTAAAAITFATMSFGQAAVEQTPLVNKPNSCSQLELHVGIAPQDCGQFSNDELAKKKMLMDND